MNFSFKSIKEKLVESLSDKFTKKQIEDAFEIAQENLVNAFQEKKTEEENALKGYIISDEYVKMKNLSYWIFNNYGIPDDGCVFSTSLWDTRVLSDKNKNNEKLHSIIKSGILGRAYKQIIKEYLAEYTDGYIAFSEDLFLSDNLSNVESIFEKIEKQLYPNYKFAGEVISNEWSQIFDKFVVFKSSKDKLISEKGLQAVKFSEVKRKLYFETFGDKYQAILVKPISGLIFDSINNKKIAEDAESWDLSAEALFSKVEHSVETLNSNGFITVEAVYNSEYLMSYALFRKVWYILSPDNEIIIVNILNSALNNQPVYYGSGADERNGRI
jgi:hypothetical protein